MFRRAQTFGETLTQPRPDALGMQQQSGEYFAPNLMLSSFGMDFALKIGIEDQKKIKKNFHRYILDYLITSTRSVLMFRGKAFVVTSFWAKV